MPTDELLSDRIPHHCHYRAVTELVTAAISSGVHTLALSCCMQSTTEGVALQDTPWPAAACRPQQLDCDGTQVDITLAAKLLEICHKM